MWAVMASKDVSEGHLNESDKGAVNLSWRKLAKIPKE
jgi:hypothetical protein